MLLTASVILPHCCCCLGVTCSLTYWWVRSKNFSFPCFFLFLSYQYNITWVDAHTEHSQDQIMTSAYVHVFTLSGQSLDCLSLNTWFMTAFWDVYDIKKKEDILKIVITGPQFCLFQCLICFVRHQDIPTRSRYVRLVDNVRDNGGTVR